jgi:hypothetical protein
MQQQIFPASIISAAWGLFQNVGSMIGSMTLLGMSVIYIPAGLALVSIYDREVRFGWVMYTVHN